jgi:hypothetical protein
VPNGRRNFAQLGGNFSFHVINRLGAPTCHLHHHFFPGANRDGLHSGRRNIASGLGTEFDPTMDENPATNFVTANEFATTTMDADPDDEQARDDETNE